jgi:TRAP-type mannitol/chloroaromatic compound transport system permease small subunit
MIPAAGVLLIIQGISEVFRSIICIQKVNGQQGWLLQKKLSKYLMRAAQDEDKKNVI